MIIRSGASEVSVPNETLGTRENNIYIQWYGCKLYAIHLDARSGPGMTPQSGIGGLILWLVYEPKRRPPKIVIHRSNGKSTEYMCNILLNTQNLTPFSVFLFYSKRSFWGVRPQRDVGNKGIDIEINLL